MPIISTYPNIIYPIARETHVVATGHKRDINHPTLDKNGPTAKPTSTHTTEGNGWTGTYEEYPGNGFPILNNAAGSLYTTIDPGRGIYPWMHEQMSISNTIFAAQFNGGVTFAIQKDAHITSTETLDDLSAGKSPVKPYPIEYAPGTYDDGQPYPYARFNLPYRTNVVYQYRGSTTPLNPENDADKAYILDQGLENFDKKKTGMFAPGSDEYAASPGSPTSPLHPFTRMYADRAHQAIVCAYNRTKLPIADIEHRKAFRYIFITRPECYLMTTEGRLCYQAEMDNDINTCWNRMPHVIRALSPVYVSPSIGEPRNANWNYLLSNRVMQMPVTGTTLSVLDSMTKGVRGATVLPGKQITSNLNGTIELTFRDTKYMDVYETLRIWMWYVHKRKSGEFYPPFNGYSYINNFISSGAANTKGGSRLHPYDRALEYGATIFDIITNETGSKILYWCKYYGVFPISANSSMFANQNGSSITGEATVSAQFQYQYKQENVFANLVEFNYNGGLFDNMGNAYSSIKDLVNDVPFLYREDGIGGGNSTSPSIKNYIGAAGLITGAPFIVSEVSGERNPWNPALESPIASFLRFLPASGIDTELNARMNLGYTSRGPAPGEIVNYDSSFIGPQITPQQSVVNLTGTAPRTANETSTISSGVITTFTS